jgi:hypothetical protein
MRYNIFDSRRFPTIWTGNRDDVRSGDKEHKPTLSTLPALGVIIATRSICLEAMSFDKLFFIDDYWEDVL